MPGWRSAPSSLWACQLLAVLSVLLSATQNSAAPPLHRRTHYTVRTVLSMNPICWTASISQHFIDQTTHILIILWLYTHIPPIIIASVNVGLKLYIVYVSSSITTPQDRLTARRVSVEQSVCNVQHSSPHSNILLWSNLPWAHRNLVIHISVMTTITSKAQETTVAS